MLQPCNQHLPPHKAEGVSPTDTWLDVAVKVVRETLAAKIIAAPRTDEAAVVFYGPRVARGPAPDDDAQVWTFNPALEAKRNARGGGGGAGVGGAEISARVDVGGGNGLGTNNNGKKTATARATAAARQARDSSGIDLPSADLLRALGALVGDGEEGEGNRARDRLFVGNGGGGGGRGRGKKQEQQAAEESVTDSLQALLVALRRASTLLASATKGRRPRDYAQRIVALSCQPLEFRSLFPNPHASPPPPPPPPPSSSRSVLHPTATAAWSQLAGPAQQQQQQLFASAELTAARRGAFTFRSGLRERGTGLGVSGAALELLALEPLSVKNSLMAGGAIKEEEEEKEEGREEGEEGGRVASAGAARASAHAAALSADFYCDAGEQSTAWGELLLASASAARVEAEAASARATKAAQLVAEEELRLLQQQQQQRAGERGADGESQQQQQLLVAALRLRQLQEEEAAARAAEFADDAALSLAVSRFAGVSRSARGKIYKRRAISTYFLLLPGGGGGGGEGEGGAAAAASSSAVACAVSLYQNLSRARLVSSEQVASRDYEVLKAESRLMPVATAAARAAIEAAAAAAAATAAERGSVGGGGGGSLFADGGGSKDLLLDPAAARDLAASRAAAGVVASESMSPGGVGAWWLGGEKAGALAVAKEAERAARDAEGAGLDEGTLVEPERARRTVACGVVEFSTEELVKFKCVGVPLEEGRGGGGGEERAEVEEREEWQKAAVAAVAAGLVGLNRKYRDGNNSGAARGGHDEGEGEEEEDEGLTASSPAFIEVLGFVPVSQIDPRRLQRSPSFLYPNVSCCCSEVFLSLSHLFLLSF